MGAEISFTNHIHISDITHELGSLKFIGFNDLTPEILNRIAEDKRVKWVQDELILNADAMSSVRNQG